MVGGSFLEDITDTKIIAKKTDVMMVKVVVDGLHGGKELGSERRRLVRCGN